MTLYNHFATAIKDRPADLEATLRRIDSYHIRGELTDTQRDDLRRMARDVAAPAVDAADEIQRLWAAVHDLTSRITKLEGGVVEDGGDGGSVSDYVQPTGAHDAYYHGTVVSYNGKTYTCIAPDGVACVWSPDVMPGYWEEA